MRHEKFSQFDGVELDPSTIWSPAASGGANALAELVKLLARTSAQDCLQRSGRADVEIVVGEK